VQVSFSHQRRRVGAGCAAQDGEPAPASRRRGGRPPTTGLGGELEGMGELTAGIVVAVVLAIGPAEVRPGGSFPRLVADPAPIPRTVRTAAPRAKGSLVPAIRANARMLPVVETVIRPTHEGIVCSVSEGSVGGDRAPFEHRSVHSGQSVDLRRSRRECAARDSNPEPADREAKVHPVAVRPPGTASCERGAGQATEATPETCLSDGRMDTESTVDG